MYHDPVLRNEAVQHLLTSTGRVFVDGTVGGGGHSEEICHRIGRQSKLVCFDSDGDAILYAMKRLAPFADRVSFVHSNFRALVSELRSREIRSIDGLLLDLGVSSFQLDDPSKGFSFRSDEKLDMRMDRRQALSGWDVVNEYSELDLAGILWKFGEEKNARRIARAIVHSRPLNNTGDLYNVIQSVTNGRFLTKTLARIFQAIRIQVNNELESLENVLDEVMEILAPGGRVVVISYHSLEDRIVKGFFKREAASTIPSGNKYVPHSVVVPKLRILTKKPIVAAPDEVARNPRARSAKLRAAERVSVDVKLGSL